MERVTGCIWILCVCVSAPVVVLSGLLPMIRQGSDADILISISRQDLEEDKWTETQNTSIAAGISTQYYSTVSHEAIYHVISNAMVSPSVSSLNPFTISKTEHYSGILETYSNHDKNNWKSDNSEIFDEILVKISRYNETLTNFGDSLKPELFGTRSGIYIDIQRIPWWIERNGIQDIHSSNNIDLTISDHYQRTSTGSVVQFDRILDAKIINNHLTSGLPHVTVMTSFPTEWSFGRAMVSTYVDTLGQSQNLFTQIASSSTFSESQEPMKTNLPILTTYHDSMMTGKTTLIYSNSGVMTSYRSLFPEEVTNRLPSQNQFYEIFATNEQSQGPLSPNLFTGLSQPDIPNSIANITGSSTSIQFEANTPVFLPPPPERMTGGTHRLGHFLETIIQSSSSFGQYQFMDNTPNLRPSQETLSILLLAAKSLPEIQSSVTSIASSFTPSASQANISTSPPPPPEITTAGTYRFELSEHTMKTRLSSFEQYKFIENTLTLGSSQTTLSNSLFNRLSWTEIQGSINTIHSSATFAQYPSNTAILPPMSSQTKTNDTYEFGHSLVTNIMNSSSFGHYQPIDNTPTHRISQEIMPTIMFTELSQSEIPSNVVSIIGSASPAQFQSNTAQLPTPSPETMTAGTHRLGTSSETLITNLSSFGQNAFTDNTPILRSSQETLYPSLFSGLSQPEIQSSMTIITSSSVSAPFEASTPILPTPPLETMTTDTHIFGPSMAPIISSSFSFEQYLFIEHTTTVRYSQEIFSASLFTERWQQEIQSSMANVISSASLTQFQSNTQILPPAIQEAMTAGTHKFWNFLIKIIMSSSSFGQNQLIQRTSSLWSSQETLSTSLFTELSQPEIQSDMASITSSYKSAPFLINTPMLSSPPLETMITGTHRFWPSMETIQNSSFLFQQYRSIENNITIRSSLDVLSASSFTGQSPPDIWISMSTIASLSKPAQSEVNTSILLPPPPEIMTTYKHIFGLSPLTIIATSSAFGPYKLIENTSTVLISQETTLPTYLFTGIWQPEIHSNIFSIISSATPAQFQPMSPIFQLSPPDTTSVVTQRLKTLITNWSSFVPFQFIKITRTLESSHEITTNSLTGLLQPDIQSSITSITSSSASEKDQSNMPLVASPPPEAKPTETHSLWHSLVTIVTNSTSFGQFQLIENTRALRLSHETLSTNLLTGLLEPEIQNSMARITRTFALTQLQVNTPILPTPTVEITTAGTHIFNLSMETTKTSSFSFEKYQLIENAHTLRSSQERLSASLSQPEIQSSLTSITILSTHAQSQVNTSILPPLPPKTMASATRRFGRSLETIITSSSSIGQYQFIEKSPTLRSSQETLSINLFTLPEIQSSMASMINSSSPTQFQSNSPILPPPTLETMTLDSYRLGKSLETLLMSWSSFIPFHFLENTPTLRSSQETFSSNLFNVQSQPDIRTIINNSFTLAQYQNNTPILVPTPIKTMTAGTHRLGLSLSLLIITSSSSFGQYQPVENTPNIKFTPETVSVSFFTVILEPRIRSSMTEITSLSILDQSPTETSILPSQPPETMSAGPQSLGISLETLTTSMSSFGQYLSMENALTLRSSHDILSTRLFTEQSQPEIQSIFTSIVSVSTPIQLQVKTSIVPSSPIAIITAGTNRIGSSLETIIPRSFAFEQYEFIENSPALRPSQKPLSTDLFTGISQPEYDSSMASITSSSMSAQFQVNTPLFQPHPSETMIARTQRFGNALTTIMISSSSVEQYRSIQNIPTLQSSQEKLSTTSEIASPIRPYPNIIVSGSHQSPSPTHFPARIAETMLMSMELISSVSVSSTTRLSTSDSYSNTIQQYYFIYSSTGPITTSLIDTNVNVTQSSASSFPSRPILLPSLTIKESKASEERTDRSSSTTHATSNQLSEVTHRPSTKPTLGPKPTLEKLCALACKLPFPPPKSCHCNQGTKFGSWS